MDQDSHPATERLFLPSNNNHLKSDSGTRNRDESKFLFYKNDSTTHSKRGSIFKRKSSKQHARRESLQLYNLIKVNGDADVTKEENESLEFVSSNFAYNLPNTIPSTTSSDSGSLANSVVSEVLPSFELNGSIYANVGNSSFRLKNKTSRKLSDTFFLSKNTDFPAVSDINPSSTPRTPYSNSYNHFEPLSPNFLHRSLSAPNSIRTPSKRKRLSILGSRYPESMSTPVSSVQSSPIVTTDVKVPSPERCSTMYREVRKAVSEHISINTAELNVLQMRHKETNSQNAAQSYGIEKLIKHLERVIKKLQYQQAQLDEIYEAYLLQQRYRDGATKLKSALNSSRVSSRSSKLELKADLNRSTEALCTLEQELVGFFGRFHFHMKSLMGFAKLRSGDQYEIVLRHGAQKWKMKGLVKSMGDQKWDNTEMIIQPLLSEKINIKVMEVKLLGKHSTVGSAVCDIIELVKLESQDLMIDLNDLGTLKLNVNARWSPFDGYEVPSRTESISTNWTTEYSRSRAKSSGNSNINNNKHLGTISRPLFFERNPLEIEQQFSSLEISSKKNCLHRHVLNEEDAFMEAISRNLEFANGNKEKKKELVIEKRRNSCLEIDLCRNMLFALIQLNFDLDDVRGRYKEISELENIVKRLLVDLKVMECGIVSTDGFSIKESEENDKTDDLLKNELDRLQEISLPTTGLQTCDKALTAHLKLAKKLLKNVGVFGPLRVQELLSLDKLQKQGEILSRIYEIATSGKPLSIDEIPELTQRRALFELWRSCCNGNLSLCVTGRTFHLELIAAFGKDVKRKHTDVADQVFPELIHRILENDPISNLETETVTLFHVVNYVEHAGENGGEDLEKLIDKLAFEMFITATLSSENENLVLVAIKRVSSLLALRISNLRALSHLLLDKSYNVRTATAAHIRHISTDAILREKALVSFAELLESGSKNDRRCACIAIGFLGALECIPQLVYLFQSDPDFDVREAASNVLLSLGEEGVEAREYASRSLIAQTMSQQLSLGNSTRLGTAL